MTDIYKNISSFIEEQFPAVYRNRGDELTTTDRAVIIDFVEAYYEFIEENLRENFLASRNMFEYRDIDTTLEEFIQYFKKKYLNELPFVYATDNRFVIKNIIDLYRSKGSEKALKLLIRLLFNEDIEVYYPAQDILRASTSTWTRPQYLEVTRNPRNITFVNSVITGSQSNATAYVESLVTKRVNGKIINVFYLSDIRNGSFITGELVSSDGVFFNAPVITGSLSNINITSSKSGYNIGDIFDVLSTDGQGAKVRVSQILETRDSAQFNLLESGFGYSLNETDVLVSSAVLFLDNSNLEFNDFDIVTQDLVELGVANTTAINIGDVVSAFNANTIITGDGFVVDKTSNTVIVEKTDGNFNRIYDISLDTTNLFTNNEIVEEESSVNLTITNANGSFSNGELILQVDEINGAYQNIAYGTLVSANSTVLQLEEAWGTFVVGKTIEGRDTFATADIFSIDVVSQGDVATIIASNTTNIIVETTGELQANTKIRGDFSKNINTIASLEFDGVDTANIGGVDYTIQSFNNVSASGEVVGQNENVVALAGNTSPFYYIDGSNNTIRTSSNTYTITRIGEGSGANFDVGTLIADTTENIQYGTDIIGGTNIVGPRYLDIIIGTAENSGIGRIANNVVVLSGGSGYSNSSTITLSGGGFANGEPIISAILEPITDGTGAIVDVNIVDQGEGYYDVPSITISDGTGADIDLTIESGYGFPGLPYSNINTIIGDALTFANTTIGEIATLKNINPGSGYNTNVFTKVINRNIANFNKYDVTLSITPLVGTFIENEIITTVGGAKGRIENITSNALKVKRLSFDNTFIIGDTITGETSTATANVVSIFETASKNPMGLNANVLSEVVLQSGIISQVDIVDSGIGYIDGNSVQLYDAETDDNIANGIVNVATSGIDEGFWKTTESHLNDQRVHDNFFYQEYSYQVIGGISLDKYEQIVRDVLHVSGTELFGKVVKSSLVENIYSTELNITNAD